MAFRQTAILKWKDINGWTRTQTLSTQANPAPSYGPVGGLMTALQAASDAGLWVARMAPTELVDEAPASGPYPTVKDVALLIFRTTAGTTIRVTVPGPKAALFKADLQTVDPEAALTVALVSAVVSALSDANGNAALTFVGGSRQLQSVPPIIGP